MPTANGRLARTSRPLVGLTQASRGGKRKCIPGKPNAKPVPTTTPDERAPQASYGENFGKGTWPLSNTFPSRRSYPHTVNTPLRHNTLQRRFAATTCCWRGDFERTPDVVSNGTVFAFFITTPRRGERCWGRCSQQTLGANSPRSPRTIRYDKGGVKCSERCLSQRWP